MVEMDMIIMIVNMVDMDMIIRLIINMMEMDMIIMIVNMVDMDVIIRLIINMMEMDMVMLTINIVENNVIIGLMISTVNVGVIKQIMKDMGSVDASVAMKDTIFVVMIVTYIVNTFGEIIRTALICSSQNKTNPLEGVV